MNRSVRTAPRAAALAALAALTLGLAACGEQSTDPGASTVPAPTQTTEPTPAPTTEPTTDPADGTTEDPTTEDDSTMTTDQPGAHPIPSPTPPPTGLPTGPVDASVQERADVQEAVAAEAERQQVDTDAVTVAGYADVTWRDGSLGCPEPGMMYTQALVPGHQLVLEVDGQLASYHAAQGKPFRYCANPVPPGPGGRLDSR